MGHDSATAVADVNDYKEIIVKEIIYKHCKTAFTIVYYFNFIILKEFFLYYIKLNHILSLITDATFFFFFFAEIQNDKFYIPTSM